MSDIPSDIAAILAFNETGAQFFKRVQEERVLTGLPIIDNNLSLRPGVVLEVAGPSGSGKTELLLSIALHVLLSPYADPNAWNAPEQLPPPQQQQQQPWQQQQQPHHYQQPQNHSPANRGSVVIFDLDGKFDGVRLMQVLEPQVHSAWRDQQQQRQVARARSRGGGGSGAGGTGSGPGPAPPHSGSGAEPGPATLASQRAADQPMLSPDQVVEEVLSRLHLVRCGSSLQLLAALAGLPARLEALQAAGSPCRLLLIDNVGAHYWRDRAARNVAPPAGAFQSYQQQHHQPQHQQPPPLALSLFEIHAAVAARLAHVSRRHRLPVVATKTAGVSAKGLHGDGAGGELAAGLGSEGGVQLQQREFMPMPWQNVVTHRLLLYPRGVVPGPATAGTQTHALQSLTAILAEMLMGAVGPAAAAAGSAAGIGPAGGPAGFGAGAAALGGGASGAGGRGLAQLLVSSVALVEEW